jgi:uncharacterized protein YhdP
MSVSINSSRNVGRYFKRQFSLSLSLISIFLFLSYYAIPLYKSWSNVSWIEKILTERIHQPVHIGRVSFHWQNFQPMIAMNNFIISNAKGETNLVIKKLSIGINLIASCLKWKIVPGNFQLEGTHLFLREKQNGIIDINNIPAFQAQLHTKHSDKLAYLLDCFLTNGIKKITNVTITWYNQVGGVVLPLSELTISEKSFFLFRTFEGTAKIWHDLPISFSGYNYGSFLAKQFLYTRTHVTAASELLPIRGLTVKQQGNHIRLAVNSIPIQKVTQFIIKNHLLEDQAIAVVKQINPSGQILDFAMDYSGHHNYSIEGYLDGITLLPWHPIPGIQHLSGKFDLAPRQGNFYLNSTGVIFQYKPLFRQPIPIQTLKGEINWQETPTHDFLLQAKNLTLKTDEGQAAGLMTIFLPYHDSAKVNTTLNFEISDASKGVKYYPVTIIPKNVLKWLEEAIKGGKIKNGLFILNGRIKDFPFDHHEGKFLIKGNLQDGILHYKEGWPTINAVKAALQFEGRSMKIDADQGHVMGARLDYAHITILNLSKAILSIKAGLSTLEKDTVTMVRRHNPLLTAFNCQKLEKLMIKGKWKLGFNLLLPLDNSLKTPIQFNGQAGLDKIAINVNDSLSLNRLSTNFYFTENSINTPLLTGEVSHYPFWLKGAFSAASKGRAMKIDMLGGLRLANLQKAYFRPVLGKDAFSFLIGGNFMQGKIQIPRGFPNLPLKAQLQFLNLSGTQLKNNMLTPGDIPPVDLNVVNFQYKNKLIRNLELKLRPSGKNLFIKQVTIKEPLLNLNATGVWQEVNGKYQTILNGNINSNNLGNTLNQLQITNNVVKGHGNIQFNLTWPASPFNVDLTMLSGVMNLHFNQGRIIELSSQANFGMGIARVLALFSLETLQRRLMLDFSDLTESGFSFDELEGALQFKEGNLFTRDAFINGPVARVEVNGRIGLVKKDYNLALTINPYVTSSLPVVATLTAGPIVGAATWLINKIFSHQVKQITQIRYDVTGSWNSPHLQPY